MRTAITDYLKTTRDPIVAALLVFPVFLVYQVGLNITSGLQNAADLVTQSLVTLRAWTPEGYWGLSALVLIGYGVLLWRLKQRRKFSPWLYGAVAVEGALQGLLMFFLVNEVLRAIMLGGGAGRDYPFYVDVILSLGAGFHEELVFRVLLFGGMVYAGKKIWKWGTVWVVLVSAVLSSLIFSAYHYVGPLADTFRLDSFLFRFLSGCYFVAVYRLRGFAVAVYSHAIYDIGIFALS